MSKWRDLQFMQNNNIDLEELLDQADSLLLVKRTANKNLNSYKKDSAKETGIDAKVLAQAKNLYHTKGNGWQLDNPLVLDPEEEKKDKTSLVFIKFLDTINTICQINPEDLKPYLDALSDAGVTIDIDKLVSNLPDTDNDEALERVLKMSEYQKIVDETNDKMKELAEQNSDLVPPKEFGSLLKLYNKKINGKEMDDEYQDKMLYLELTGQAFSKVYDEL